jgi:hypothetical protein
MTDIPIIVGTRGHRETRSAWRTSPDRRLERLARQSLDECSRRVARVQSTQARESQRAQCLAELERVAHPLGGGATPERGAGDRRRFGRGIVHERDLAPRMSS